MLNVVIRVPCQEVASFASIAALLLWLSVPVYLYLALKYEFTPVWILLLVTGAFTFSTCAS
jgi:hypothetical protein